MTARLRRKGIEQSMGDSESWFGEFMRIRDFVILLTRFCSVIVVMDFAIAEA